MNNNKKKKKIPKGMILALIAVAIVIIALILFAFTQDAEALNLSSTQPAITYFQQTVTSATGWNVY